MNLKFRIASIPFCCILFLIGTPGHAQFIPTPHKTPTGNIIPVTGPGSYGKPGATYMLVNDVSSPTSTLFLGKDVTLDLNGYTLRYANGNYEHIPNSGFEEGVKGWDLSKAPGAAVVNTEDVHVFIGKKLMSLKKGDEITSSYVNLPVANRSYFALCGVTGFDSHEMGGDLSNQMKVSVYVDDEKGNEIRLATSYPPMRDATAGAVRDTTLISCPVENKSPRLGGGFVYAHLHHLPTGKYRIRVRAETDCLVDEIDIRPAMDVGIGMVEKTFPMGHYDHLYQSVFTAFFDYTSDIANGVPFPTIPRVAGAGTVTIRNGSIENGVKGIVSWGIQSTAENVKIILDNVKIKTSGINTTAVDVPQATITRCRFEVDNPFLINRHNANFYAVDLRGVSPSEVSFSEFIGGQGCLVFKGNRSTIHHNYFVNKQMVTNHYSIMAMGDSSSIFENRIEPEVGSGIEIYVHKYINIFNNLFKINTSPPTCEYGHEEYSTAAIRMADYNATPGASNGCYGNKVYNNTLYINGREQSGVPTFLPMSWGIYYSASGGENDIFGNEIIINKANLTSNVITSAFYICGGQGRGGNFYNNRITTNVPAAWVATMYGGAANTKIYNNTIIKSADAGTGFMPFRMGWAPRGDAVAQNIEFRSNEFRGTSFTLDRTDQAHTYSVYWTLTLNVVDKKDKPVKEMKVKILDKDNQLAYSGLTDDNGKLVVELLEYSVNGSEKTFRAPYSLSVGIEKVDLALQSNSTITVVTRK